jgi:diaminopimelate epimerase
MTSAKNKPNLSFIKFEAAGNDFVLLDAIKRPLVFHHKDFDSLLVGAGFREPRRRALQKPAPIPLTAFQNHCGELPGRLPNLARRMCDRHFGVGADGLLVVQHSSSPKAAFRMRMFNLDGSEDMCGNGLRSTATYLYTAGYTKKSHFLVQTCSGLRAVKLALSANKKLQSVAVNLGPPRLRGKQIPVSLDLPQVLDYPLKIRGKIIPVTALSTGTPHAVVFLPELPNPALLGQAIIQHPFFPEQASVSFVKLAGKRLFARTWERGGVGESLSCGTGAAAILVAANLKGLSSRQAEIIYPGGKLRVRWDNNNDLWLSGPVNEVFRGRFE